MKITIATEIQPFQVPHVVHAVVKQHRREDVIQAVPCYQLSDLDSDTLARLCDEFRDEVFRKAGKEQPPMPG